MDVFWRIVRLGGGLHGSGRISDAAIDRAVAALSVCADKLVRRHVTLSRAVATEACRRAVNCDELVWRVRHETGIALDLISAAEEARLECLGCPTLLEHGYHPGLIFNRGGDSPPMRHETAT